MSEEINNIDCVEWNELGQCVKFKKSKEGKLIADFKTCTVKNKNDIADEFRKRLRKGVIMEE